MGMKNLWIIQKNNFSNQYLRYLIPFLFSLKNYFIIALTKNWKTFSNMIIFANNTQSLK